MYEWLRGITFMNKYKKELSYWNEQLKILKDNERFIWDYCDESSYKKSIYKETFDKEYGDKLNDICKNNSLLIYTFLVSTLKITLSKYMGKNDIVIGIPRYASKSNVGNMNINKLLPLVSYIDYEKTYLEYMDSIKTKVLESYKNQAYLNSKILLQNNLPNNVMELTPVSICMKGLHEDKDINYICESSKNELSFLLELMEDKSIGIQIVYNSNKITEVTVKTLYESYVTALEDILNNHNKKVKDIKILSEKDVNKILYEFNDTKVDYPEDKTIHELFEVQVERTPDNIAVMFEDKKLTYRELNERSNSLATILRDKGVKADSIVGVMVERSLEMIVGIIGILKAGGAYLPIDSNYPKERIEYMLSDSGSKVLLSKNALVENIKFHGEFIDLFDEKLFKNDTTNIGKINDSNNLAYIIYTSGTTGKPKGAMIEHRSLVNRLNWMQKKYPIGEKDTILQKTTYTFDVSVWEILWWSLVGAKVCMLSPNAEKDPMKIIETIDKYEVTTMHFVPSMLDVFLYCVEENRDNINLSSLRQVFSSGEALNFKQVSKFYKEFKSGKSLVNLYGPTEATIDVSYFDCINDDRKTIPIGKPIDNTELYILKNDKLASIGVSGEIYIAGDGLARGYLNRPELTAEKFVDNPFKPGAKMYKTGDLARWLHDGNIEFLGRIDNQVKIRGFRIELGEIENRLLQHEGIKEAVALVKETKDSEKNLCAYIVSQNSVEELNIKSFLKEVLPEYMIPAYFVRLDKMPLTANGKLDRRALPEPNLAATLTEYEAPRNEVEETLAKVWSEALGIEKVGINDNFFDLGGYSLKATVLMSKIHKALNKEVPLKELFKAPTIKELSKHIRNTEDNLYSKIEKVEEKEYYEA
ncbi:non-ribosomal peptide synthetase, partial [Clostridium sp. UBA2485]|uniref:non-ribosomal peptide synthetase n=1 Tax=Clostridium sp. UBA2485 TaxID=1946352 RepID=UPI0039C87465